MLALDKVMESDCTDQSEKNSSAFDALEKSVYVALESYANVHRGTGHFSVVSTRLYERAREIVLEYMGRDPVRDTVLFCTPRRADELTARLAPASYELLSSEAVGLPLGLRAVAVPKRALPRGIPYETGGGVVKLVSRKSVAWADAPDRYEAGTPPIMTVIAWARALQLARRFGSSRLCALCIRSHRPGDPGARRAIRPPRRAAAARAEENAHRARPPRPDRARRAHLCQPRQQRQQADLCAGLAGRLRDVAAARPGCSRRSSRRAGGMRAASSARPVTSTRSSLPATLPRRSTCSPRGCPVPFRPTSSPSSSTPSWSTTPTSCPGAIFPASRMYAWKRWTPRALST